MSVKWKRKSRGGGLCTCRHCGIAWLSDRKRKYCPGCVQVAYRFAEERQCKWCGNTFVAKSKDAACCSNSHAQLLRAQRTGCSRMRTCKGCGKRFKKGTSSRNAGRYCTRECAWKHDSYYSSNRWKQGISDGYVQWANTWRVCKWCGRTLFSKSGFCGANCRQHHRIGLYRACTQCGEMIDRKAAIKKRICEPCATIAARAQRKRAKLRRKYRMTNLSCETIRSGDVFKRDGYRCGICGCTTNASKVVPHPRAPTLDHIIPLARGGTHTMSNVQCACFECNWKKADTIAV